MKTDTIFSKNQTAKYYLCMSYFFKSIKTVKHQLKLIFQNYQLFKTEFLNLDLIKLIIRTKVINFDFYYLTS